MLGPLDTEGKYEHLFVNHSISTKTGQQVGTGKPYTTIMKVWGRLRVKAGLPHLRIHDLRNQYASCLVNAGFSLYSVQACLGHSDPKVTQRYAHLSTKSLQDAANSASLMIMAKPVLTVALAAETVESAAVPA